MQRQHPLFFATEKGRQQVADELGNSRKFVCYIASQFKALAGHLTPLADCIWVDDLQVNHRSDDNLVVLSGDPAANVEPLVDRTYKLIRTFGVKQVAMFRQLKCDQAPMFAQNKLAFDFKEAKGDKLPELNYYFLFKSSQYNLRQLTTRFKETWTKDLSFAAIGAILMAINEVHGLGIIHRDLRPECVLMRVDGNVTFSNLEYAIRVANAGEDYRNAKGIVPYPPSHSLAYTSPELVWGMRHGPKADVYSIGAIAFELCLARDGYKECNEIEQRKQDLKKYQSQEFWQSCLDESRFPSGTALVIPNKAYETFRRLVRTLSSERANEMTALHKLMLSSYPNDRGKPLECLTTVPITLFGRNALYTLLTGAQ